MQTAKNEGWNKERLRKEIASRLEGKYKARAENIARTELGKLNSAARLSQYNEVGIKYYRWLTTIDGRERQSHRAMNGVICSVSNPHVYYTENANAPLHPIEHYRTPEMFHGNPGEDFQCRCSMVAWDPEIDGMYEVRRLTKEELIAGSELEPVSTETFAAKIAEAKQTQNKEDGWRVTTETAAEFENDHPGSAYFCTKGGSVAAVSPDGDIFGVCKSLKDGDSSGKYILANAVKAGGKKLDSYEGNHKFYCKCGFEPISWCKWDPDFAPDEWKTAHASNMADAEDIIFYAYTGKISKYKTAQSFKAAVPASTDYGEAMAARDRFLKAGSEAEAKAEALKKAFEIREEIERAIKYGEELRASLSLPEFSLMNSVSLLKRNLDVIEKKVGWENLMNLPQGDLDTLRANINKLNKVRIEKIAEDRHKKRNEDAIAVKWRKKKEPFVFGKIQQIAELFEPMKKNAGLKFQYGSTNNIGELLDYIEYYFRAAPGYSDILFMALSEYSKLDGHWEFLASTASLNESAFDYVKKNGHKALIDEIKKAEAKEIKALKTESIKTLQERAKLAEKDAQSLYNRFVAQKNQASGYLDGKNWKGEPIDKSGIAEFWTREEDLSWLWASYEKSQHRADVYKKAIKQKQLGTIAKRIAKPVTLKQDKDIPTLQNLSGAINRAWAEGPYAPTDKRYVDSFNLVIKHRLVIEQNMSNVFMANKMGMNVNEGTLRKLLQSGRFKNQFETNTSGGWKERSVTLPDGRASPSAARTIVSHSLFGVNYPTRPGSDYEKYGYLLPLNIEDSLKRAFALNTSQYGIIQIRFNDKIKEVATFTPGDSLGGMYQPSKVTNPNAVTFKNTIAARIPTTQLAASELDINEFAKKYIPSYEYLELQYHGEIPISLIESISFPYDLDSPNFSSQRELASDWKTAFEMAGRDLKIFYLDASNDLKELVI